jgi:tRNA 2-thiouridine synthesizing protein C
MSQILFVMSRSPGSINAQEGFDALLMGSAFATCSVVFLGTGLFQLVDGQDAEPLGGKNFSHGFGALNDYGVSEIYCNKRELDRADLAIQDLSVPVRLLDDDEVNALFNDHQMILSF